MWVRHGSPGQVGRGIVKRAYGIMKDAVPVPFYICFLYSLPSSQQSAWPTVSGQVFTEWRKRNAFCPQTVPFSKDTHPLFGGIGKVHTFQLGAWAQVCIPHTEPRTWVDSGHCWGTTQILLLTQWICTQLLGTLVLVPHSCRWLAESHSYPSRRLLSC
jgi:hypothetical protein